MRPRFGLALLVAVVTLAVACGPPSPITFGDDVVEVTLRRADGAIDVRDKATGVEVRNLHFALDAVEADGAHLYTSLGRTMSCKVDTEEDDGGVIIYSAATCEADTGSGVKVQARLELGATAPGVLRWKTEFENRSGKDVTLRRIYPFRTARSEQGSFLIGDDPQQVRVLQNGSDELVDFFVAVYPGSTTLTDRSQPAIVRDPSTYSNGSALAHDLATGASFLAGFVAFDWATPQIAMAGDPAATPVGGRVPMTEMWAEARFPWDVAAAKGKTVSGGAAVMIFGAQSPHVALEAYANLVKTEKGITLPPAPYSGWDSWYLGPNKPDLTEGWARTAADSLAASFQRYGLSSMQLDEGWQDAWGDWNANTAFPSGMAATADHIKAVGLRPEIWIAPFDTTLDSQLATAHPDWLLEKNNFGVALIPEDKRALDISRAEVVDHVRGLGTRIKGWGYQSVKMDFAYYTLLSEMPVNIDVTNTTAYRAAVQAFREALGPDIYLINISMCFPNYGLVDAFRVGLDDWPCWDGSECRGETHGQAGISAQGLKPALRMAARRYWMNGRIWWNHHDQIFFRDLIGEEAQAWISAAALSGGMISLGEDPTTLTAEQIDMYRRILPLQGLTARPMDLLTREYPEVWDLATDAGGDAGGKAHVVGLFNWGTNRDLGASPPVDMAEETRTVALDLATAGLDPAADYLAYEFWTNTYVGTVRGTLSADLAPRTVRVYRLVAKPVDAPAYLATNRHVLMGAGIVDEPIYTPGDGILVAHIHTTLAHQTDFLFYVPDGYTVTNVDMDGVLDLQPEMQPDGLLRIRFTGLDDDLHPVVISVARL